MFEGGAFSWIFSLIATPEYRRNLVGSPTHRPCPLGRVEESLFGFVLRLIQKGEPARRLCVSGFCLRVPQEEAATYTIVGATIFIKADYWSSGSWTRKVPIAESDLAATLKLNQGHGANFSTPSRPREVINRYRHARRRNSHFQHAHKFIFAK
jgi:hypothetical protein